MKWYGSVTNRIEEKGKDSIIEVGTPMTEYFWSDSYAWETIKVFDQTHVVVREYKAVCVGGFASNEWKLISDENQPTKELKKRYGNWWEVIRWKKQDLTNPECWGMPDDVRQELTNGKNEAIRYRKTSGKVRFGIARKYYDYEF